MPKDAYISVEDIENYLARKHPPAPTKKEIEEAELMLIRSRLEFVCKQAFIEYMVRATSAFQRPVRHDQPPL